MLTLLGTYQYGAGQKSRASKTVHGEQKVARSSLFFRSVVAPHMNRATGLLVLISRLTTLFLKMAARCKKTKPRKRAKTPLSFCATDLPYSNTFKQ